MELCLSLVHISDLLSSATSDEDDKKFAREVLRISHMGNSNTVTKQNFVTTTSRAAVRLSGRKYYYCREYRPDYYTVNSVDGFAATGGAKELMRYPDSNLAAAVGYRGEGGCATFVMGFPFESITDSESRDFLMKDIVDYLIR